MTAPLDYLLISPAYPFRGGIADSTHQLALALEEQGYSVEIWTFTQLYPKLLFPGTSPFTKVKPAQSLIIKRMLHAYNPLQWQMVIQQIKKTPPKRIIFRYYSHFLAPSYGYIAKRLKKITSCSLLVDNWKPHEPSLLDTVLTRYIKKAFKTYCTLSEAVAEELRSENLTNIRAGFHPIANDLPKPLSKEKARKALGWPKQQKIALFYGLVRPYKGLDLLLEAMTISPASEQSLHLAVVGEFYESIQRYTNFIENHKLNSRIYLYPEFADNDHTQLVFSAADLLILPYRSASQSGVLALAYHFETPLLVTNHPGLAKPVLSDDSGWVCSPNSSAISQALAVCSEAEILDKKNKIRLTKDQYSWESFVAKMHHFLVSH